MGLLDSFKSGLSQFGSKQETPAPAAKAAPAPTPAAKAVPAAKPEAKDTFRVKFGDQMPYYDPEFGNVMLNYNGFAEVKSESWAKDPKREDFVKMIINTSISKSILKASEEKVPYNDLTKRVMEIRRSCDEALKEKNIEPKSIALNTITLTAESKAKVDSIKKGQ